MSSFDEEVLILGAMLNASSCNISAIPPGRERDRTGRMTICTFKIRTSPKTTVDNKPKQNWATDSSSPLLAHWERMRLSVQFVTLASVIFFFFFIKRMGASLALTFITKTWVFFTGLGCFCWWACLEMWHVSLCDYISMKYSTTFFTCVYPTIVGSASNKIVSEIMIF